MSRNQVKRHLGGMLASYKIPKVVEFRDELPREVSGKISKRKLRESYWAGTGRNI